MFYKITEFCFSAPSPPPVTKSNNSSSLKITVETERQKSIDSLPSPLVNKHEKDDDFIPMTADKPSGLDLDDFLPVSIF